MVDNVFFEVPEDIAENVYDIDNFAENIRLRIDYYIHLCLSQMTRVFEGDVTETEGFKKYIHLVGHLEMLCRSNGLTDKDFKDKVENFEKEGEKLKLTDFELEVYVTREKFGLLTENIFKSGAARGALHLHNNPDGTTSRHKDTYERIEARKELLKEQLSKDEKNIDVSFLEKGKS